MQHQKFSSIPRLYRDVVITEKIDGSNAAIIIEQNSPAPHDPQTKLVNSDNSYYTIGAQSRTQILTPDNDMFGFATWVWSNARILVDTLGEGRHFGEYWGQGIHRSYHQQRNWFSLFNTKRWNKENTQHIDGLLVVPVLYEGKYDDRVNYQALEELRLKGSVAAQQVDGRDLDFRAEGIVGWHVSMNQYYKVTLNGDGHKGQGNPIE